MNEAIDSTVTKELSSNRVSIYTTLRPKHSSNLAQDTQLDSMLILLVTIVSPNNTQENLVQRCWRNAIMGNPKIGLDALQQEK